MRILHAADLHLGKTLHERELIEDQKELLSGLLTVLERTQATALLLAGDLYDRSIPPPEAIGLFDAFLSEALSRLPELVVVAIPGNHDSAARLSFGSSLLRKAGIHLRTRPEDFLEPVLVKAGGEEAAIWALPFLSSGASLEAGKPGSFRSQSELFAEAIGRVAPRLGTESGRLNLLLAHCFARGGAGSESERAFLGLAEEVDPGLLSAFDYAALGHLHRPQAVGPRAWYSGSPMTYSFSEAGRGEDRGVLLVDVAEAEARVDLVPLKPRRRLARLEGSFAELSLPGACAPHREDYVEVRLSDALPVVDPSESLKPNFPYLLSVRQAAFDILPSSEGRGASLPDREGEAGPDRVLEDFSAFHSDIRSEPPDGATLDLVRDLLREVSDASL